MASSNQPFNVAVIGGGLCGLALAIALKKRSIPFTVYEARSSFTELGAGINVGPNTLTAFNLIDHSLGEAFSKLAARNPPGKEDVWFQLRFGASSGPYQAGDLITELMAPPTGNITVGRNALLQLLAEQAGLADPADMQSNAKFNKKLSKLEQTGDAVHLHFDDGTLDTASVAIGCDGIHSAVRKALLGADNPAAQPQYSEVGAYRALLPISKLSEVLGDEIGHTSAVFPGPDGYLIMYPTTDDTMNTGFWRVRKGNWPHKTWVLPSQKAELEKDFEAWGETVHKVMSLVDDPPFFATFCHAGQPESFHKGRVLLIGDAAHAMPPHAGAGAGQAMEDAYVIAEVLSAIAEGSADRERVEAALQAYENVRTPRSQAVLQTSIDNMDFWSGLYSAPISKERLDVWVREANAKFGSIWHHDLAADARKAVEQTRNLLPNQSM